MMSAFCSVIVTTLSAVKKTHSLSLLNSLAYSQPIIYNLFIENFEEHALRSASILPRLWKICIDIKLIIQKVNHGKNFLECINNIDMSIKFTVEDSIPDSSMSFLVTLVTPEYKEYM